MRGATSVDELLTMLRAKKRRLPSEIGAFVALQATEALLDRAFIVDAQRLFVRDDGTVELDSEERCDEAVALEGVRTVLGALLVAAGEGVPPMMLALVDRAGGTTSLGTFRDMLEAALVPLNRGAATRVLARSLRDIRRESDGGARALEAADADFDALLDGRDAPGKAEVMIVAPELGPEQPRAARSADPDKRSIFRDDEHDRYDDESGEGTKTMAYVALAALALAVLGGLVFFTR